MENYLFFNSVLKDGVYDREYKESDFAKYFGNVLSSGLLHTDGNPNLVVTSEVGTMNTIISPGSGMIKGHLYENTTPLKLTHSIPEPTVGRIDRVVLRLDVRTQSRFIKLFVKEGVSSAMPVPPDLQRDNYIYEISLAKVPIKANTVQITGSDIVDERLDQSLCGLVHSLISIPTDQLQNWIATKKLEISSNMDAKLAEYMQAMVVAEAALQETITMHTTGAQTEFDNYKVALQTKLTQFENEFRTWLDGLKSQMGTNVALSLQNQVNIINGQIEAQGAKVTKHIIDVTSHVFYGVAEGIDSKTINVVDLFGSLIEGAAIAFKNNIENVGAATLNINELGAKPIVKSNGSPVNAGNLKAGSIYTVRYSGTSFILQGEGGEYGTALADQVLSGYTVGTDNGLVQGTIANKANANINSDFTLDVPIPKGYYDGTGKIMSAPSIAGDTTIWFTEAINTSQGKNTWEKIKSVQVKKTGIYRVHFNYNSTTAGGNNYTQLYVNGVAKGALRNLPPSSYVTYREDISVNKDDIIQLYMKMFYGPSGYTSMLSFGLAIGFPTPVQA